MKPQILIEFGIGTKHCRLLKDIDNRKLIVKAFSKKKSYKHEVEKEFPQSEKGLKQAFSFYKDTFHIIFVNELKQNKYDSNEFIKSLDLNTFIDIYKDF